MTPHRSISRHSQAVDRVSCLLKVHGHLTPINLEILMSKLARAGFMYAETMYCNTVEEMSVPIHQARVEFPDKGCEMEEQRATPYPVSKKHKPHVDAEHHNSIKTTYKPDGWHHQKDVEKPTVTRHPSHR